MEEKIEISILLSLYGSILTETQKKYMELYYNEDLSLSEIGDNENITRQAVRTILVKSKNKLKEYESQLGFMKKQENIKKLITKLEMATKERDKQELIEKMKNQLDF